MWLALAWRHGGARGVDLVTGAETPDPSPDVRAIVEAAAGERRGPGRRITTRAGWVQVDAGVRLGRARDGRWYRLDRVGRAWELRQPPADDVADLLDGA